MTSSCIFKVVLTNFYTEDLFLKNIKEKMKKNKRAESKKREEEERVKRGGIDHKYTSK